MNCSDETAAAVDDEVMKILKEAYKEAKSLLKENRRLLDKLAQFLIEKETITGKEFMQIYREEKGLTEEETSGKGRERVTLRGIGKSGKDKGKVKDSPNNPITDTTQDDKPDPDAAIQAESSSADKPAEPSSPVAYDGMGAVVRGRKDTARRTGDE